MTTIATDGRTMAADTLAVGRWKDRNRVQKIHEVNGCLVGGAGEVVEIMKFKEWFAAGCPEDDKPEMDDSFVVMVLTPEGKCYQYYHKLYPDEWAVPHAIGSGAEFAMGAMMVGATPKEAVEAASMLDTGTNSDIIVLELEEAEEVVKYTKAKVVHGVLPDADEEE